MSFRRIIASAAVLISISCILPSRGGNTNVHVYFAETDAKASEGDLFIQATVRVEGAHAHNFTLTATPLTVAQYLGEPGKYGNSCLSAITTSNIDPAEEKDFSSKIQVETAVPPGSDAYQELYFNVSLFDDTIEEDDEYFLLLLDIHESDVIEYDEHRQCVRLTIIADEDSCKLLYEQTVMEANEDAGEIELLRISKQGETELPVKIYISGNATGNLMISPTTITLQPNETSATVFATIIDDPYPEDEFAYYVNMNSDHGSRTINITIHDNDYVEIGFDKTEVTVVEGEMVLLNASFKNNITSKDYAGSGFNVYIYDEENVTGRASKSNDPTLLKQFHPESGNRIEVPTVNNNILEGNRHFKVRLVDPTPNKFTKIHPDNVTVTVRDNDGLPNQPKLGDITFSDGTITLSWTVSRNDLRPIEKYIITIHITGSRVKRQTDEDGLHQIEVNLADIQCKFDQSSMTNHCEYTIQQQVKKGKTYNITLCAENEFGKTCQSSGTIIPTEVTPIVALVTGGGLPVGVIVGIVISVLVVILLFSLLFISLAILKRRNERKEMDQEDSDSERYTHVQGNQHSPNDNYNILD